MKRFVVAFLILLACSVSLQAQKIKYETSFEKAKALAIQEKKPLAVLITIQPPTYTPNFTAGLNDRRVVERFNRIFINYRVDRADTVNAGKIIRDYKIYRFPSFIFLDAKGGLMFTDIAPLSCPEPLLEIADRAIAASKEKSMADYDREYAAGSSSKAFLKEYIAKRQGAGITDNADVIEKYVKELCVADLNKYDEVLFILKAGPVIDGNAYKLSRLNRHLIDSIYKVEPLEDRKAINNASIANTMNRAIASKNFAMAMAAAKFTRDSWSNNFEEGQKNWYLKLIQYYSGVKDTVKYLQESSFYFDHYYMQISVDSVRKKDSLNLIAARNNATVVSRTSLNNAAVKRTVSYSYTSFKDSYSVDLNNAAWRFYLMAGDKNDYLLKAMQWSRRSIEVNPKPAFYDTYAHILYRLKLFDEAESMERKALEMGKAEKSDVKVYQEEYGKIKSRNL